MYKPTDEKLNSRLYRSRILTCIGVGVLSNGHPYFYIK